MTARPPRASTKSDARAPGKPRRARTRGATQSERDDERPAPSVLSTDRYERIGDDDVLEVTELPAPPSPAVAARLRMLVLETAPHLATAQAAIVGAGHAVAIAAAGRDGLDKLRFALGDVDAVLVGMPGGEPLIEAAFALGARRPVVIAAWTSSALEAARRAPEAGADLATVRPHHVERLAPLLLAASRLVEHRRLLAASATPSSPSSSSSSSSPSSPDAAPEAAVDAAPDPAPDAAPDAAVDAAIEVDVADAGAGIDIVDDAAAPGGIDVDLDFDDDFEGEGEGRSLLSAELFAQVAQRELERARRDGRALAIALFALDVPPPPPPPALRGIVRARAGNALVHALRAGDLATELDQDRFLVVMPDSDRAAGAEHARRVISAVAAGDPVTAVGRTFPTRVIGAVTAASGDELDLPRLVRDATQLLEQAQVTGASLAVES
jgi:hypothetical protein